MLDKTQLTFLQCFANYATNWYKVTETKQRYSCCNTYRIHVYI